MALLPSASNASTMAMASIRLIMNARIGSLT